MRPTTSSMLQQNNNNNYPCLNVSGSTREMLQKCSRASLPFPSRMELGLGDLPLIRGLRAWALCSKNRRKAGGLLSGGQTPTAPPAGRGGPTSCPRPADVYLSGEWGRMGYGLPMGLDARQVGIGSLVTVATLKTSEGSGKTQTQCLFLRTEKGSCLYSTAKPSSGLTTGAASSVVGGWLRGKTGGGAGGGGGGGGSDIPAGRRDNGPTPPSHTGVNRVRVRSGRRWRKSGNAAAREKADANREGQESSREDPAGEITPEERQEERDKGGLASKQSPRREKEEVCRNPRCCHSAAPKTCSQCGKRAQRRESQDERDGGESPRRGDSNRPTGEVKGMRKERQKNEEEDGKGGLCGLESSNSSLAVPNLDLEAKPFHPQSHSGCDVEEIREVESNEELRTQTSQDEDDYSGREEDTNSEVMKLHPGHNDLIHSHSGQVTDDFISCPLHVEVDKESGKEMESVEEEESINQTPADLSVVSVWCEDISVSVSDCPAAISTAVPPEPSAPVEGSTCNADPLICGVQGEQENSRGDHLEGYRQGLADPVVVGTEELVVTRFEQLEPNLVADENNTVHESASREAQSFIPNVVRHSQLEEREASSLPLRHGDPSIFETDVRIVTGNAFNCSTTQLNRAKRRDELAWGNRKEESEEENVGKRVKPEERDEAGAIWRREGTCDELDDSDGKGHEDTNNTDSTICKGDDKEATINGALKDNLLELADESRGRKEEVGDTCGQTSITHVEADGEASANVTNVAYADPSLANPAPSSPPLGSMATSLPCLEAVEEEEEEEEEGFGVPAEDEKGGQEGNGRFGRPPKEPVEEESGSTVATEERRNEEEVKEEDEFGVFMQAEGEPAWSGGDTMSASVHCGSRGSVGESHNCWCVSFYVFWLYFPSLPFPFSMSLAPLGAFVSLHFCLTKT